MSADPWKRALAPEPPPPRRLADCPPANDLEEMVAGERAVTEHVTRCEECRPYLAALEAAQDAWRRQHDPDLFLRKLASRRARPSSWQWLMITLPAFAVVVAIVAVRFPERPEVTLKGEPLQVYYRAPGADRDEVAREGTAVRAAGSLRFKYRAPQDGFVAILEQDGSGRPSVLYPYGGENPAPVQALRDELLPGSFVLDDAPGPESIIAVYSRRPFAIAPLLAQLRRAPTARQLQCESCLVHVLRLDKTR